MAFKKADKIAALEAKLPTHPFMVDHLARFEDRINDFVSQFEMGVPHRGKEPATPRLTFTATYEPDGIKQLAEFIVGERGTPDHVFKEVNLGLPVEVRIKGPRAEECAELLTDACNYSGIEYGKRIYREKDGSFSITCRPSTIEWQEQIDNLHDFARANFENRDLLIAMHKTERKLIAMAKAKPGLEISTQLDKSYTADANDAPVLHLQYQTMDPALVEYARARRPYVTVRKHHESGEDSFVISARFKNPATQGEQCAELMAQIIASAERAPVESKWQDRQPELVVEKAAAATRQKHAPSVRAR